MSFTDELRKNRESAKQAAAEAEAAEAKRSDAADAFNMRLDDFVSQYRKWSSNNKDAKYSKATDDELKERITGLIQKAGVADEQINSGDTNSYDYYKYGVDFLNGMDSQKSKGLFGGVKNKIRAVSELSASDKAALAEAAKFEDNYKKYKNGEIQDWRAGIDQEKAAKGMQVRKSLDTATRQKNKADNANDFFDIFENYESYMSKDEGDKNGKASEKAGGSGTTDSDTVEFSLSKANDPNYKGFGQKLVDLGLATENGLWGENGDVAYYTKQLNDQGIYGNLPIGKTIRLKRRK